MHGMLVDRSGPTYGVHPGLPEAPPIRGATPQFSSGTTSISVTRANLAKPGLSEHARPVGITPVQWHCMPKAVRAVGGVGVGDDIAPSTNVVTFFSTFATNLVHAMSEIYRDICLQMQRHSRHVVTFAYRPVGR